MRQIRGRPSQRWRHPAQRDALLFSPPEPHTFLSHRLREHIHQILRILVGDGFVQGDSDPGRGVSQVDAPALRSLSDGGLIGAVDPERVEVRVVHLADAKRHDGLFDPAGQVMDA